MAEKSKGFWSPAPAAAVEVVLASPDGASVEEDSEDFLFSDAPDFSSEKEKKLNFLQQLKIVSSTLQFLFQTKERTIKTIL